MFKLNRERLQQALKDMEVDLTGQVMIMNKSYSILKFCDDCEYFPTKFDPYLTWFTGMFYCDINMILHLDTLEMVALYATPTEVDLEFLKHYTLEELEKFGVTNIIYEDKLVDYLTTNNVTKVNFIRGGLFFDSRF